MSHICLLSTPVDLFERWMKLLEERPVTNGGIFDLLHIAIMLAHQVTSIYTFNAKDFSWCFQIEVIDPGMFENLACRGLALLNLLHSAVGWANKHDS